MEEVRPQGYGTHHNKLQASSSGFRVFWVWGLVWGLRVYRGLARRVGALFTVQGAGLRRT